LAANKQVKMDPVVLNWYSGSVKMDKFHRTHIALERTLQGN